MFELKGREGEGERKRRRGEKQKSSEIVRFVWKRVLQSDGELSPDSKSALLRKEKG